MSDKRAREIAVVVMDEELERKLEDSACATIYVRPDDRAFRRSTTILVAVRLLDLAQVAEFVREANRRHYLRGVFVRDDSKSGLLPQVLYGANLRTIRNLVLHSGTTVPRRAINAYCMGSEHQLIVDARVVGDHLFVLSCAGETYDLSLNKQPALESIPPNQRATFEIAAEGAYIYWPHGNVHLDLEDIRYNLESTPRRDALARRLAYDRRVGEAIAEVRREAGLRQADIAGFSDRQVRRYEHGDRPSLKTFGRLAAAHRMKLDEYLDRLAAAVQQTRPRSVA